MRGTMDLWTEGRMEIRLRASQRFPNSTREIRTREQRQAITKDIEKNNKKLKTVCWPRNKNEKNPV